MTVETRTWYVYRVEQLSLRGWHHFGFTVTPKASDTPLPAYVGMLARCCTLMMQVDPDYNWFAQHNEYWVTELPGAYPIVAIRRGNPFDYGFVVSPVPLPHLAGADVKVWEIKSA